MQRNVSHKIIVHLHREIAVYHKGINGFYRFNLDEISNGFRKGIEAPTLLLLSNSGGLSKQSGSVATFNGRDISFYILDFTGKADNYDKQEIVLDTIEAIVLDIASYLKRLSEDKTHWLFGLFDRNSYKYEKVGPVFDNMYGWLITYTIKNHEPLCLDETQWDFTQEVPAEP